MIHRPADGARRIIQIGRKGDLRIEPVSGQDHPHAAFREALPGRDARTRRAGAAFESAPVKPDKQRKIRRLLRQIKIKTALRRGIRIRGGSVSIRNVLLFEDFRPRETERKGGQGQKGKQTGERQSAEIEGKGALGRRGGEQFS